MAEEISGRTKVEDTLFYHILDISGSLALYLAGFLVSKANLQLLCCQNFGKIPELVFLNEWPWETAILALLQHAVYTNTCAHGSKDILSPAHSIHVWAREIRGDFGIANTCHHPNHQLRGVI